MTTTAPGTVLITGPTGGLGRAAALAMASRPAAQRPDLLLVGRPGAALREVAEQVRAAGAITHEIGCDLARLAEVRGAAIQARELQSVGAVRPLRALVANAGVTSPDTHRKSADGYELTFAVNYLAHAQLIGDLLTIFSTPARIVLLGSNTYYQNCSRRMLKVPPARWRDPCELAQPCPVEVSASNELGGVAYSNSKLAILYYAHELQRRAPSGVNVAVFEPGFMPGTGLARDHGPGVQRLGRLIERIPGVSSAARSGPLLASLVCDDRWAHLRDGTFVVKDTERHVQPFARDAVREARLWTATTALLTAAGKPGSDRAVVDDEEQPAGS